MGQQKVRSLSKSKLIAFRQCPKRLWLEIHKPELREESAGTEARYKVGNQVGDIARHLYDPQGKGILINAQTEGYASALERSAGLLATAQPLFEAGFSAGGALAFADVMLPARKGKRQEWRMVEVKSSTSVKDYHRDDASIQAFVAKAAGVPLASISVAYIDNNWVYPGEGNYAGLLKEDDLTEEAFARADEVRDWISKAQTVAKRRSEPEHKTGSHCTTPFECGFSAYCQGQEPQPKHSVDVIPRMSARLRAHVEAEGILELADIPDELLNPLALRVKQQTLLNTVFFDAKAAAASLAKHKLPAIFLDFETVFVPVPIWPGTRPYQQVPFQFSAHRLSRTGRLEHTEFLDLSGEDPSKGLATALVKSCGTSEPVFVYNAGFEKARISELAARYRPLRTALLAINERIVDLLPIARDHYYNPSQNGSWSIKAVLPAVVPELTYDELDGVQNGGMAVEAFLEAIYPETPTTRREALRKQLSNYCRLDTYAMVRLWQVFAGRQELKL